VPKTDPSIPPSTDWALSYLDENSASIAFDMPFRVISLEAATPLFSMSLKDQPAEAGDGVYAVHCLLLLEHGPNEVDCLCWSTLNGQELIWLCPHEDPTNPQLFWPVRRERPTSVPGAWCFVVAVHAIAARALDRSQGSTRSPAGPGW